jgi:membrane fusion protein (multidrug efflux system)
VVGVDQACFFYLSQDILDFSINRFYLNAQLQLLWLRKCSNEFRRLDMRKVHSFFKHNFKYLLISLGLLSFFSPAEGQQAEQKEKPVPVIVKEAKIDRFVDYVEALGTLRANETVDITATVTDTVTAIHFDDGRRVNAGDILVEMTHTEEHALLDEARSTLKEARIQYERVKPLVERGAAARSQLDQQQRDYNTAGARYRAIESRLQDLLIVAPFSGVVGLRNISVGALIEPGDIITTLDDDSIMKLDFTVPAIHLATLKIGLPIQARAPSFSDRTFPGEVSAINSRIDQSTRSIVARAILPNPDRLLKPGLLMNVRLLNNPRDVVVIPEEALIPTGQENHVLVVDQYVDPVVVERRKVKIGARRPGEVEIVEGLKAGEGVVIHGTLRARAGQQVEIIAVAAGNESLEQLLQQDVDGRGK